MTNHDEDREVPQYSQLPSADTVEFRCEWSGLLERRLSDPDQMGYDAGQIALTDHIVTVGEWPVIDIRGSWPEIVSAFGGPVLRLFDHNFHYTVDLVRHDHVPRFKV